MVEELRLTAKAKADKLREDMCRTSIDQLIAELEKIPDQVLLNAARPSIKLKIKLV